MSFSEKEMVNKRNNKSEISADGTDHLLSPKVGTTWVMQHLPKLTEKKIMMVRRDLNLLYITPLLCAFV